MFQICKCAEIGREFMGVFGQGDRAMKGNAMRDRFHAAAVVLGLSVGAAMAQDSLGEELQGDFGQPQADFSGQGPQPGFGADAGELDPPQLGHGGQQRDLGDDKLGYGGQAPEFGAQQPGHTGRPPDLGERRLPAGESGLDPQIAQ